MSWGRGEGGEEFWEGRSSKGRGGRALLSNGNAGPLAKRYRWRRAPECGF